MKLEFVILHHGKQFLEAGLTRPDGMRQVVKFSWLSRDRTPMPPHWWAVVVKEAERPPDGAGVPL
jgi:hypothetical protein